jgi:hypothetical protein
MAYPVSQNVSKGVPVAKTTTLLTDDLWAAVDALDALPHTHGGDWYKRIVAAAEAATQAELAARRVIEVH